MVTDRVQDQQITRASQTPTVDAFRPDGNYPKYQLGDLAVLVVKTNVPDIAVYRGRHKRPLSGGSYQSYGWTYLGQTQPGPFGQEGWLINALTLPDDPNLLGDYIDTIRIVSLAIGNPEHSALRADFKTSPLD